jgi:hypothetical protein
MYAQPVHVYEALARNGTVVTLLAVAPPIEPSSSAGPLLAGVG